MQSPKRRQYTEAFRQEAVRLITAQGSGVTEAARNLGINAPMLGRWTRQMELQKKALRGNGHLSVEHEVLQRPPVARREDGIAGLAVLAMHRSEHGLEGLTVQRRDGLRDAQHGEAIGVVHG